MKLKTCSSCSKYPRYARGLCLYCDRKINPSKHSKLSKTGKPSAKPIKRSTGLKNSSIKKRIRKPTGEKALMDRLWQERGGRCAITGKFLGYETDVWCCLHVLGKKSYPSYRLNPDNVVIAERMIHHLYDNSSKEKLLTYEPRAIVLYEMKDELRRRYYDES